MQFEIIKVRGSKFCSCKKNKKKLWSTKKEKVVKGRTSQAIEI